MAGTTGEGPLDARTARGGVPGEVTRRARGAGVPVLAPAGALGAGAGDAGRPCQAPWPRAGTQRPSSVR
ncbi:glycerate kinase [Streptomyces sp. NPDC016309]|uniref:glycerate kinase n=1 Tax=Streptomyces sp. NPDC016309 TaxID=3364965 RepID=UPI0037025DDF